jgi:hypothetical protein
VTVQPVRPVIPSGAHPAVRDQAGAGSLRRLPLASVPEVPAAAGDALYGFGRIDASGRVADAAVTTALGWRAGDRLPLTAAAGVVLARRDPEGLVTVPARPYLAIPAPLRRRCGLEPGDRILLAVFPSSDALAAYSFTACRPSSNRELTAQHDLAQWRARPSDTSDLARVRPHPRRRRGTAADRPADQWVPPMAAVAHGRDPSQDQ